MGHYSWQALTILGFVFMFMLMAVICSGITFAYALLSGAPLFDMAVAGCTFAAIVIAVFLRH